MMDTIGMVALLRIDLPTATIRLCDGGYFNFGGETYLSADPVFGSIGSVKSMTEGVGDEIPALEITLLPAADSAAAELSQPGQQRSEVRCWVAQFDIETGAIIGTPDLQFLGQIDQTTLGVGRDSRDLSISVVSKAERLFNRNEGNSLNATWHKSVWPGELGHDQATGLSVPVAWGVEAPAPASIGGVVGWAAGSWGRGLVQQ